MHYFNVDKSEYTQYLDIDDRWYRPINELLQNNKSIESPLESSFVNEVKKNDIEIRWNTQWKGLNEIKNVNKFNIIYGSLSKSITHMIESQVTLVGALANITYYEYYNKNVLKEKSEPIEIMTCIYAFIKDMNTLIISLDERSFPIHKANLLCDLVLYIFLYLIKQSYFKNYQQM